MKKEQWQHLLNQLAKVFMLLAIIGVAWMNREWFYKNRDYREVSIEYIENEGNPWGVSFEDLRIDGIRNQISDNELSGFNIVDNDPMLTRIYAKGNPARITFNDKRIKYIQLTMNLRHTNSKLQIFEDGSFSNEINFAGAEIGAQELFIGFPKIIGINRKNVIYYLLFSVIFGIYLYSLKNRFSDSSKSILIRFAITISFFVMAVIARLVFKNVDFINNGLPNTLHRDLFKAAGSIYIADYLFTCIFNEIKILSKEKIIRGLILLFATLMYSLVLLWGIQNQIASYVEMKHQYDFANIIIISGFIIAFGLIFGYRTSIWITTIMALAFGLANLLMIKYRNMPLLSYHFSQIGTFGTVQSNIDLILPEEWVKIFLQFISMAVILTSLVKHLPKMKFKFSRVAIGLVILALHILLIIPKSIVIAAIPLDYYNMQSTYSDYGSVLSFFTFHENSKLRAPLGNKTEKVAQEILKKNMVENENFGQLPDVIVIQSESQTDFVNISSLRLKTDPMSYQKSLYSEAVSGDLVVSVLGGGTANTEYEVLTSLSLSNLLKGFFPYQTLVQPNSYSMVSYFNKLNYHTVAMHPFPQNNYSRNRVYDYLGFEQTYFSDSENTFESLGSPVAMDRYIFMSDESLFSAIQNYTDQNKTSANFIFAVTMQGHGGYNESSYETFPEYKKQKNFKLSESVYFTSIRKSDLALKGLVEHYKKVSKPTVIVIYGDHQPILSDKFYDKYFENEDRNQRYKTPFMIWANYDISSEKNVEMSPNYLMPKLISSLENSQYPLPQTAFYNYLSDVQKSVKVMSNFGYMDSNGNWSEEFPMKEFDVLKSVEYNTIFSNKEKDPFYLPEISGKP